MTPFEIQQRVYSYINEEDSLPLIRRMINEAITNICYLSDGDLDFPFLYKTYDITTQIFSTPEDFRNPIDVICNENNVNLEALIDGKFKIVNYLAGNQYTLRYYCTHPVVLPAEAFDINGKVKETGYEIHWTATNPPDSLLLLPKEFHELVIWKTLDLLFEHEIEIAASRQFIQGRITESIVSLRAKYTHGMQMGSTPFIPTGKPKVNDLVNTLCHDLNTMKHRYKMLTIINRVIIEVFDVCKINNENFAIPVVNYTDDMPELPLLYIDGGTNTLPLAYDTWLLGCQYYAEHLKKPMDEAKIKLLTERWNDVKVNIISKTYQTAGSPMFIVVDSEPINVMETYGGVFDMIRANDQTFRNDHEVWKYVNMAVADAMSKIDISRLNRTIEYTAVVGGSNTIKLPRDFKKVVRLSLKTIEGNWIQPIGKNINDDVAFGRFHSKNIGKIDIITYKMSGNYITFSCPLETDVQLIYTRKHVFCTEKNEPLPVDFNLIMLYCDAKLAMRKKDPNGHTLLMREYEALLNNMWNNEINDMQREERIINASPNIEQLQYASDNGDFV